MWLVFGLAFFSLVVGVVATVRIVRDDWGTAIPLGMASVIIMCMALLGAEGEGRIISKIQGEGNYYEIVVATPVLGKRTLVYAVDLDGDDEKTDVLAEYPMKGYKVEKVGKRTLLLPVNTTVTTDNRGKIFIIPEDGGVFKVEGPVGPPSN